MKFCTECGHKLSGGEKFCPACGFNLQQETTESDSEEVPTAKESVAQTKQPQSNPTPSPETSPSGETGSLVGRIFRAALTSILPAVLFLGIGYFLQDSEMFYITVLWLIGGSVLFFALQFRGTWRVDWYSSLVPAVGIAILSLIFIEYLAETDIAYELGDMTWAICLSVSLLGGLLIGLLLGHYRKLTFESGNYTTNSLVKLIAIWGVICASAILSLMMDLPGSVILFAYLIAAFGGAVLSAIFLSLFFKRFLLPKSWLSSTTATSILLMSFALAHPIQLDAQPSKMPAEPYGVPISKPSTPTNPSQLSPSELVSGRVVSGEIVIPEPAATIVNSGPMPIWEERGWTHSTILAWEGSSFTSYFALILFGTTVLVSLGGALKK